MRTGLRWQWDEVAYHANDRCELHAVSSPYDRDWWFLVVGYVHAPTMQFRVFAYDTRATAEADYAANSLTNYIASTTAVQTATGVPQTVTLTKKTSASWDCTPMTVTLSVAAYDAAGGVTINWGLALLYWTATFESYLVERIVATFGEYCDAHEALAALGLSASQVHANPVPDDPHDSALALDVLLDPSASATQFGNQGMQDTLSVACTLWVRNADPQTARDTCAALAATVRAIAVAQRTWGGLAAETTVAPVTLSVSRDANAFYVSEGRVQLTVLAPDWRMQTDSATYPVGYGGRYAYDVQTALVPITGAPNPGGGAGHGGSAYIQEP